MRIFHIKGVITWTGLARLTGLARVLYKSHIFSTFRLHGFSVKRPENCLVYADTRFFI